MKRSISMKGRLFVTLVGTSFSALLLAQTLPLSRAPLFVRPAVDPNIVLTFDDSGSMNLGITPNEIEGTYLPSGDGVGQCFWRDYPHVYSAAANTQYYDPTITYAPPVYANGNSYPNAVFTAAYYDGFDAHRTGTENTGFAKRNLATDFAVSLYDEAPPAAPTACSPTPIAGRSQLGYFRRGEHRLLRCANRLDQLRRSSTNNYPNLRRHSRCRAASAKR
jgi:hypothetical protein